MVCDLCLVDFDPFCVFGMGRTWEKFSSLPLKNHENSKSQPEKNTFSPTEEGRISGS